MECFYNAPFIDYARFSGLIRSINGVCVHTHVGLWRCSFYLTGSVKALAGEMEECLEGSTFFVAYVATLSLVVFTQPRSLLEPSVPGCYSMVDMQSPVPKFAAGVNLMQTILCLSVYGEMYQIDFQRVMYLQADDHYTHVYYASGTHFMVPFGLSKMEAAISEKFPEAASYLLRLGRKYIVNTRRVFHINVVKQVLQVADDHGTHHSLTLPKPVLRALIHTMSHEDITTGS